MNVCFDDTIFCFYVAFQKCSLACIGLGVWGRCVLYVGLCQNANYKHAYKLCITCMQKLHIICTPKSVSAYKYYVKYKNIVLLTRIFIRPGSIFEVTVNCFWNILGFRTLSPFSPTQGRKHDRGRQWAALKASLGRGFHRQLQSLPEANGSKEVSGRSPWQKV